MHYLDARRQGYGADPGQQVQQLDTQQAIASCHTICAAHGLPYKGLNASGQCTCQPAAQTFTPPPPIGPPPPLAHVDCVGLPHPYNGGRELPSDFMKRVQQSLNYAQGQGNTMLPLVPVTGVFDFLTSVAWGSFVRRYGSWDSATQKYIGSDPQTITCDGLMLLKKTNDQIYATQQNFIGDIDDGTPGGAALTSSPSGTIQYVERDKLWLVSPDSRPDLRHALSNLTHNVFKTGSGGTVFARCQQSSAPIPLGQDALTQLRSKIAAGYAAMIHTTSDFSSVVIAYTKSASTIAHACSTQGALRLAQASGSMNGFGIDTMTAGGQQAPQLPQIDPSKASPPDPMTGLPSWALYEGEPPTLIDAARALFTVTGGAPSPATDPTPPGGGGYVPSPYPSYGPPAATPPAAAPAATSPSWVKPLAIAGGIGLVAYAILR